MMIRKPLNLRAKGKFKPRIPGVMNKLEAKYAEHLRSLQLTGVIYSFRYERHNLKLADKTYFKPDFEVMLSDGTIEFHEVKGFMQEDANVKIKVAADQFPEFTFKLVTYSKAGWSIKIIGG
jgi:hypothetical protein